jgi:hypothetical protein
LGGGGGGGGGSTAEEQIAYIMEAIASGSAVMAEKINVTISSVIPGNREKLYFWRVFRVADGIFVPSTYLVSKEQSHQSQVGSAWKYDTFSHVDFSTSGFTALYSTSTSSVTATPTIFGVSTYNDNAKMHLSFSLTITVTVLGITSSNSFPVTTSQTWTVNE